VGAEPGPPRVARPQHNLVFAIGQRDSTLVDIGDSLFFVDTGLVFHQHRPYHTLLHLLEDFLAAVYISRSCAMGSIKILWTDCMVECCGAVRPTSRWITAGGDPVNAVYTSNVCSETENAGGDSPRWPVIRGRI